MSARPRILALFGARVIFGSERGNIEALAALRDNGCEVLCLVRHEPWNDHVPAALAARGLASRKVPFIDGWLAGWRLWILFRNPIAFCVGNWRAYRIVREFRPTHIHAFNHLYVLSFVPLLILSRIPMIYRAGDKPTRHRWFWRVVWSFIVGRTDRFVAISRFIAGELESTHVNPDRIEVIYGVPPRHINSGMSPPIDRGLRNVVFVGQITEDKGPHFLIEAFRNLAGSSPDARLLIVGRVSDWHGDDWARSLRDRTAKDPILRERVSFLGFVEDVPTLLRSCEVLVAPSLWEEPLGLVVMEAKQAGTPSIVFPSGGLPEMIEHGVDGYVCRDKTVEALEDQLRFYLNDRSLVRQHGAAARDSLARFGIANFGRRWLGVYKAAAR
jgi:glycosyltransferase involved in cell wall biosynthesis